LGFQKRVYIGCQLADGSVALLRGITHLVTVSPEVVLGPDVLEGVLGLVLERGAVRDVLPVLGPEPVGVDTGEDDAGDHDAVGQVSVRFVCVNRAGPVRTRWTSCARCLWSPNG
jgi:hypothetical protein